jgi:hypothetical protein
MMKSNIPSYKVVLGRGEVIHFVDVDVHDVPAKPDTGAYRSSIHARGMKVSEDGKTLTFEMFGGHPLFGDYAKTVTTDTFKEVEVESSFGHRETRFCIKLKVSIGGKKFISGFTLADRSEKLYPVLLGRTLLNKRFIVDSSLINIDKKELRIKFDEARNKG